MTKTIGLIGGSGWVSTVEYYKQINELVNSKLGGYNYPKILLYSLNYGEIVENNKNNEQEKTFNLLQNISNNLISADAECLALCANTPHIFAERLEKIINVPLIHIAETTAKVIKKQGITMIGLLGTKITMEQNFYKDKLLNFGINTIIPDEISRNFIHESINNELIKNIFQVETRNKFYEIIRKLKSQGAEAIVMGCTEIPLLLHQEDIDIQLFDTLQLHVNEIVQFAISE